jgi:hypothetical protein
MSSLPHTNGESKKGRRDFPLADILTRRSAADLNGYQDDDWDRYLAYEEEERAEQEAAATAWWERLRQEEVAAAQAQEQEDQEEQAAPELLNNHQSTKANGQAAAAATNGTATNGQTAGDNDKADPARRAQPVAGREETVQEAEDDPHRLARQHLKSRLHDNVLDTIVHWQEDFHYWSGKAYVRKKDKEVLGYLTAAVKEEYNRLTQAATLRWTKGPRVNARGQTIPAPLRPKCSRARCVAGVLSSSIA